MPTIEQSLDTLWNDLLAFFSSIFGRATLSSNTIVGAPRPPTLSAHDAIAQAIATESNLNPRDFQRGWYLASNPEWQQETIDAQIRHDWNPGSTCGGLSSPGLTFQQASSYGIQGAGIAASAIGGTVAAVAGSAIPGVGLVIGAIAAIFAHHKAAVARDNNAECVLIPASNNAFKAIIDAVNRGQITPAQGGAALDAIPQQFIATAGPAYNHHPYCNALCEYLIRIRAIVFYWKSQFNAMG